MGQSGGARILVVDDDVELQRVFKRIAEGAGYQVVQAFDGGPAVALATTESFDLVLLDINMPTMDGRDVLKRLKENPHSARVPVLVYSARDSQYDRHLALELGAEDFLDKPCDPKALVRKIGRLIDRAREAAHQK